MSAASGSWTRPESVGGLHASRIEAQDWYVLSNIGVWLRDPGFEGVGIETGDDVYVYFDRGAEDVQVKSGVLTRGEALTILERFQERDLAAPGIHGAFRIVARSFGDDLEGLSFDVARLHVARASADRSEREATELQVRERCGHVLQGKVSTDFFIELVHLVPPPATHADIAKSRCMVGLNEHYADLDPYEQELASTLLADRIRELRVRAGGRIARNEIDGIVERARQRTASQRASIQEELKRHDFASLNPSVRDYTERAARVALRAHAADVDFERQELSDAVNWIRGVGLEGGILFVLGDAGEGKSILLAQTALRIAQDDRFLPIWIDLSAQTSFPRLADFELPMGLSVARLIELAAENGVQPLLMVDTLDAVDSSQLGLLLGGTAPFEPGASHGEAMDIREGASVVLADRKGHFYSVRDARVDPRDLLELAPLSEDQKQELFGKLSDVYGLNRNTLTNPELAAASTPQHVRWIALALSRGTALDTTSPMTLIERIWEQMVSSSTDRAYVGSEGDRRLIGTRKQGIVYSLAELSLQTGTRVFTDKIVLDLASVDVFGAQSLAELLADGILERRVGGYSFSHSALLEWARTKLATQDPSLLANSLPRESFEAEYRETRLGVQICLADGSPALAWTQLKHRLLRRDNKSGLAAIEVLFEEASCLQQALPELVGLIPTLPDTVRPVLIDRLGRAYATAPPPPLLDFAPVIDFVFGAESAADDE